MKPNPLLKFVKAPKITAKGVKNIEIFSFGKRGLIYTGMRGKKKVAIKAKRAESKAGNTIKNEAEKLKILNKQGIGPKLIRLDRGRMIYEFVNGEFIEDFAEKSTKKDLVRVLRSVFLQCHKMDTMKLNKEEMHHPVKHVIVSKKKPVMIDFERCHQTDNPKNVTQFCQYIISSRMTSILAKKGVHIDRDEMIKLAQKYKADINAKNLKAIMERLN